MYITKEELSGFDTYKYSCVDTSPLANYVMHPFWNQFVKLFPKWLAPNVMTFVGYLLLIIQLAILTYYDPYYTNDSIPAWVWGMSAVAQFFSHTLDGIDGKQARRTGTSSPLGELFDHGLDSMNGSLFMFCVFSVFGRDLVSAKVMMAVFWVTIMSFFFSHWEKYNTGILYLPWAYDLSQVCLLVFYIVTMFYGQSIWGVNVFGIPLATILKTVLFGGSIGFSVPVSLRNVYVSYREKTGKNLSLYESMLPFFSPCLCFIIYTVWIVCSPSDILEANPRLVLLAASVVLSNILCRLIVAQMSGTRCQVLNPFISLSALCLTAVLLTNDAKTEVSIFWMYMIVMSLAHIHYGVVVVNTLADHFNIKVFSIKRETE